MRGETWAPYTRRSRCAVAANSDVEAQVDALTFTPSHPQVEVALTKGAAEFLVVSRIGAGRGGGMNDSWCELRISSKGARLRSLQGPLGFLALGEAKTVPFGPRGEGEATVVLPTDLLQARISGSAGTEFVVQAESSFMRDCIVHAMRRFNPQQKPAETPPATPMR